MQFEIIGVSRVTLDHAPGTRNSRHIATDVMLEIDKGLDRSMYFDKKGSITKEGSELLSSSLTQGIIATIHMAHQNGFRDSAEHLRHIINELERGFVAIATITEHKL